MAEKAISEGAAMSKVRGVYQLKTKQRIKTSYVSARAFSQQHPELSGPDGENLRYEDI